MSYLRHVCADKGHVCPSTAVEGTDAIRLYTCLFQPDTVAQGSVPHFISPLMIPQNKLYVPDDSAVFGAALLSQCFLPVRVSDWTARTSRQVATIGLETRKRRRTDLRYDIFFVTPFVRNLQRLGTADEYQLHPASLFASCISIKRKREKKEKKRNRPDSPSLYPSSAFSSSRQRCKRNAKKRIRREWPRRAILHSNSRCRNWIAARSVD